MTDALKKQISDWREACQHVDDLIRNQPDLSDLDVLHRWFSEVHGWLSYLAAEQSRAEAYFAVHFSKLVEEGIPEAAMKAIKGSSTSLERYAAGKAPELYSTWQTLSGLNAAINTILFDMRTNIATLREADKRDAMQAPAQR
jgi:hypothetical protein